MGNSTINLGKYGSFRTNDILGRPYNLTFEILERSESTEGRQLRTVPAAELHAQVLLEEAEAEAGLSPEADDEEATPVAAAKSNMNITDNPSNQKLSMAEIEELKQNGTGSSQDLIAKIMESHSALDQKTAFSLAKYTLRKHKKYMKRFQVLPLDVANLTDWMMAERDFSKVMEIRNEMLGLIGSWANVHAAVKKVQYGTSACRYLIVDDTGGLVVAAMAERMGILYESKSTKLADNDEDTDNDDDESKVSKEKNTSKDTAAGETKADIEGATELSSRSKPKRTRQQYGAAAMSAKSNSLTLIHANQQPNLALLRYFNFDLNNPSSSHPLYARLKTLSWLQLVHPQDDTAYQEPPVIKPEELATMKSSKRSTYYRKRRRWERTSLVIDETRAGDFEGLIVASYTNPVSILRHAVPLLAGGSQVVVYSPHIEPLVELADLYSSARRTAFLSIPEDERHVPSKDFPLDPTLLLAPMVQTARVRKWQVLPGRTHPLMTSKGGAEGYVFSATRVLPAEGKISARGRPKRAKKAEDKTEEGESTDLDMDDDGEEDQSIGESSIEKRRLEQNGDAGTADNEDGAPAETPLKRQKLDAEVVDLT